jgi:hypothetical protein
VLRSKSATALHARTQAPRDPDSLPRCQRVTLHTNLPWSECSLSLALKLLLEAGRADVAADKWAASMPSAGITKEQ